MARIAARRASAAAATCCADCPGQDDTVLVAPVPRADVALRQAGLHRLGEEHERLVTGLVAEGVVDRLEVVRLHHQQARARLGRHDPRQLLFEERPVEQAREPVPVELALEVLDPRGLLGNEPIDRADPPRYFAEQLSKDAGERIGMLFQQAGELDAVGEHEERCRDIRHGGSAPWHSVEEVHLTEHLPVHESGNLLLRLVLPAAPDGDAPLLHEVQLFPVGSLRKDDLSRFEAPVAAVARNEGELFRAELGEKRCSLEKRGLVRRARYVFPHDCVPR